MEQNKIELSIIEGLKTEICNLKQEKQFLAEAVKAKNLEIETLKKEVNKPIEAPCLSDEIDKLRNTNQQLDLELRRRTNELSEVLTTYKNYVQSVITNANIVNTLTEYQIKKIQSVKGE